MLHKSDVACGFGKKNGTKHRYIFEVNGNVHRCRELSGGHPVCWRCRQRPPGPVAEVLNTGQLNWPAVTGSTFCLTMTPQYLEQINGQEQAGPYPVKESQQ